MIRPYLIFLLVICIAETAFSSAISDTQAVMINIVPQPMKVEISEKGSFTLKKDTPVVFDETCRSTGDYLLQVLAPLVKPAANSTPTYPCIRLNLKNGLHDRLGREGYLLTITENQVAICAADNAGLFYGVQTLRQLLGPDFEKQPRNPGGCWNLPCAAIEDKPRFSWRAYMLDEARFFQGKDTVKRLLDEMAFLKMNIFHWHLTDDQGWRIEIKKYPLLTDIGSKRKDSQKVNKKEFYGAPHEGFYTQDDIREIVSYAAQRHITIVPEIDMPGHATAAIASYPWLGVTGRKLDVVIYHTRAVEYKDILNVTDPNVIQFCRDVLDEIISLFPGEVIHIGGDEVLYELWEKSAVVQDYMKRENIESYSDLQLRFTNTLSHFLESRGKRMMGWNDILGKKLHSFQSSIDEKDATETLAANAVVHFWKGDISLMNQAAQQGYDIVNSQHSFTYLDYTHEKISLEKAYGFEPIPAALDAQHHNKIKGLGCQLWTEYYSSAAEVCRQTFPRLAAYAEVGWTPMANRNFSDFQRRVEILKHFWDIRNISYSLQ